MNKTSVATIWTTGIAIFSMFFGAGNVVFPLLLGYHTAQAVPYALIGLLITAVGAPLLGLLGAVLFEADCKQFFHRIGKIPGNLVILLIIAILGPLGVMPRCFIVAYGALQTYFPDLTLFSFSAITGVMTFVLIVKRELILPWLGFFLSPLLMGCLLIIVGAGLFKPGSFHFSDFSPLSALLEGLAVGYNTMDLLASIFFALSIWMLLKEKLHGNTSTKQLVAVYTMASLIGGALLGLIYLGLSYSAALHASSLINSPAEQVLTRLSIYLLGSKLAIIANVAIFLACMTTIMSLAVALSDVICLEVKQARRLWQGERVIMLVILVITVLFSNLGFAAIMRFLHPLLSICYPAIIVLTICNILYKLYGFSYVKLPVYATLLLTLGIKVSGLA